MRGREYLLDLKKISEKEKGYLFGVFKGDGYSFHNTRDRHYSIEFYLNSKTNLEIIKQMGFIIRKLQLNPLFMKDKRFGCVRMRINSKNFFNFIRSDFKEKLNDKDFAIGFISGFLDAEGHVNSKRSVINIVNTDLDLIKTASEILDNYQIENKIKLRKKSAKDKLKSYILHISVKFKSLNHLSVKAGKD